MKIIILFFLSWEKNFLMTFGNNYYTFAHFYTNKKNVKIANLQVLLVSNNYIKLLEFMHIFPYIEEVLVYPRDIVI